jgi:hypothetical protein
MAAWLSAFLVELLTAVLQEVATGKLSAPYTATLAESDPVIQQQGVDALAAFDKDHP